MTAVFPLALTHLRFTVEALTPVRLGEYEAGSRLRGALGNIMRRAHCTGDAHDPQHAAACPVCWLLAANEHPGQERRGYALVPPVGAPAAYAPGQSFAFGLTLFGNALRFLPYFVLAVPAMGAVGVGPGRGQLALRTVWAADPLSGQAECLLAPGDRLVRTPTLAVTAASVKAAAEAVAASLDERPVARLGLNFLTPMRLIQDGHLLKVPDFGAFFARLLKRLDELSEQFAGGGPRVPEEVRGLQAAADRVRLVETQTRWVEVRSGSTRRGEPSWISGFVGSAHYSAPVTVWQQLLPWLIWGQGTQVGKDVVKGNGWFELVAPGLRRYGRWLLAAEPDPARTA